MNANAGTFETESVATHPAMLLPAFVGFFFSIRIIMVLLSVRIFQQDPQTGVIASLGLNFLLLLVVVFHSIGPAPRTLASILRLPSCLWVLLFVGFSGASLLWTVAASLPAAAAFWAQWSPTSQWSSSFSALAPSATHLRRSSRDTSTVPAVLRWWDGYYPPSQTFVSATKNFSEEINSALPAPSPSFSPNTSSSRRPGNAVGTTS